RCAGVSRSILHQDLLKMFLHRPCNDPAKADRNSVTDMTRQDFVIHLRSRSNELISAWKTLQQTGFAQGNGPVLARVTVPSVSNSRAMSGQGRCWFIPCHPTIDGPIRFSCRFLVACELELIWPVVPRTACRGVPDSRQICFV